MHPTIIRHMSPEFITAFAGRLIVMVGDLLDNGDDRASCAVNGENAEQVSFDHVVMRQFFLRIG